MIQSLLTLLRAFFSCPSCWEGIKHTHRRD